MKADTDVGIEASSVVTTSRTWRYGRWYGRWHGNVDASECVDTSSRTNAGANNCDGTASWFVNTSGCGAATAMQPLPAAVRTLVVRPAASCSPLPAARLLVFVAVEVGEIGWVVRQIEVVRLRQRTRLRRTQMRQLRVPRFLIIRRRQQKPMSQI